MQGQRFRLTSPTIALRCAGGGRTATRLPLGACITLKGEIEGTSWVEVQYHSETLEIFSQDLTERGELLREIDEPPFGDAELDDPTVRIKEQLDAARQEFESARDELSKACKIVPDIGIQNSDGDLLWSRTTKRYNVAMKTYDEALRNLSNALLGRTKPEG